MTGAAVLSPACIKTLSAVEAQPDRSNQHEFNGVSQLKEIFGKSNFVRPAIFSVRGSNVSETADVTWYDARASHPIRSEYRLYFKANVVMKQAKTGDNIIIGFGGPDLHVILIPAGTPAHQPGASTWQPVKS